MLRSTSSFFCGRCKRNRDRLSLRRMLASRSPASRRQHPETPFSKGQAWLGCMYIVRVSTYACTHVHMNLCTCVCVSAFMYLFMYRCMCFMYVGLFPPGCFPPDFSPRL